MTAQIFIMLLNPGIGLVLAAAFFLLWSNQRSQRYILIAAAGYVFNALGFLFLDVVPRLPADFGRVFANGALLLSSWLLGSAILMRFKIAPPHLLFGAVAAAGFSGLVWFLYVTPDLTARVMIASVTFGSCLSFSPRPCGQLRSLTCPTKFCSGWCVHRRQTSSSARPSSSG